MTATEQLTPEGLIAHLRLEVVAADADGRPGMRLVSLDNLLAAADVVEQLVRDKARLERLLSAGLDEHDELIAEHGIQL